jgi:glucose-6-phosphate isomerase, archaeal
MGEPSRLLIDPETGHLTGATGRYEKRLRDLAGLFHDTAAFDRAVESFPEQLAYEVYEHRSDERAGDLIFGTTLLMPGTIGREYLMTRGHLHRIPDRTEVYQCLRGRGVLLMEHAEDGDLRPVEMTPGSVVYVGPHWIHRSVNVGTEPLIVFFCYPADSGQDYEIIERSGGMGQLVVDDHAGGWALVDNPRYRSRRETR